MLNLALETCIHCEKNTIFGDLLHNLYLNMEITTSRRHGDPSLICTEQLLQKISRFVIKKAYSDFAVKICASHDQNIEVT